MCVAAAADGSGELKNKEHNSYVRAGIGFPIYRHVGGGTFHPHPKFRISGNAAIGFRVSPQFILELEGVYMKLPSVHPYRISPVLVGTSKMNYTAWAGFVNGIFNLANFAQQKLTPYIGFGVGLPLYSKQVSLYHKPTTYKVLSMPRLTSLEIESIIFCTCLIMLLILRNFSLISQNISIIKCGPTFLTKKTGAFNIA
jgi:hypothetical protein